MLRARIKSWVIPTAVGGALLLLSGCVLNPKGTDHEKERLNQAGKPYETADEKPELPEIPTPATWQAVLQRSFLANGELEAAYFEWKAAMARIPQVANYPNTNLAPSFSYMFSGGNMKAWDRTTVNVGFDPMENLSFPTKVAKAGEIALEDARAAGHKFEGIKFELQRKVLVTYLELNLHEEKLHIQEEQVALLQTLVGTASDRLRAGGNQQDMLRAQTQYRLAQNELANMRSEHITMIAMLNAMMQREPNAPIVFPPGLATARVVRADDAQLIAMATDANPDLLRLSREVAGRDDALELARMGFIPDINPFAVFAGNASQSLGAMVVIPTTIPEIRGRIDEMRALLHASQAMLRQAKFEKAAAFVAALYVMRNSERQTLLLERTILPSAQQTLASARDSYATGRGSFADVVDAQRTLLDIRQMIAETRIEREKRLAELEALAGVDIETIKPSSTAPASQPAVPNHDLQRAAAEHHNAQSTNVRVQ